MKCQSLFSRKNKINVINLSSAELTQSKKQEAIVLIRPLHTCTLENVSA